MLLPLYELADHEGLRFAYESDLDIGAVVDEASQLEEVSLNNVVLELGFLKANLLAKLGIFSVNTDAEHFRDTAWRGDIGELRLLLAHGADPASAAKDGRTALHATMKAEVAELLCEAGAPVAALDGDKNTTVLMAAACGRKGVLEVLLGQEGAREFLDQRNKFGKAAIHYTQNRPEIREMLIQAGANPDLEIGPKT